MITPIKIMREGSPVWTLNSGDALCYIDAYQEPYVPEGDLPEWMNETCEERIERLRNTPTHLCRLRHFDINRWSVAFYTYSNEKYSPCVFSNGNWFGTMEDAFDIGAVYLDP